MPSQVKSPDDCLQPLEVAYSFWVQGNNRIQVSCCMLQGAPLLCTYDGAAVPSAAEFWQCLLSQHSVAGRRKVTLAKILFWNMFPLRQLPAKSSLLPAILTVGQQKEFWQAQLTAAILDSPFIKFIVRPSFKDVADYLLPIPPYFIPKTT